MLYAYQHYRSHPAPTLLKLLIGDSSNSITLCWTTLPQVITVYNIEIPEFNVDIQLHSPIWFCANTTVVLLAPNLTIYHRQLDANVQFPRGISISHFTAVRLAQIIQNPHYILLLVYNDHHEQIRSMLLRKAPSIGTAFSSINPDPPSSQITSNKSIRYFTKWKLAADCHEIYLDECVIVNKMRLLRLLRLLLLIIDTIDY
jgi:hypothetical protein